MSVVSGHLVSVGLASMSCVSAQLQRLLHEECKGNKCMASTGLKTIIGRNVHAFHSKLSFRTPQLPSRNAAPPTSSQVSTGWSTSGIHATPGRSIPSSPPVHSRARARWWRRCCEFIRNP